MNCRPKHSSALCCIVLLKTYLIEIRILNRKNFIYIANDYFKNNDISIKIIVYLDYLCIMNILMTFKIS